MNRKQISRCMAIAGVLALASLGGCRNTESTNAETVSNGTAAEGVGGTGVGVRSTQGQSLAPTGSSTQRMGTGYGGPVSAPGPGQSGR